MCDSENHIELKTKVKNKEICGHKTRGDDDQKKPKIKGKNSEISG